MKALTCEMCGSNDVVKVDGMFVCQHCKTKYSVEEAKKMMIEGNVDVSGSTVKIDNSKELENLYKSARRAKETGNTAGALKYYEEILAKDPNSWEATFYPVYYRALNCTNAEIRSAAKSVNSTVVPTLNLIKKYVTGETNQFLAVRELYLRCITVSNGLFYGAENYFNGIDLEFRNSHKVELVFNCKYACEILYSFASFAFSSFSDNDEIKKLAISAKKEAVSEHSRLIAYCSKDMKDGELKLINLHVSKIKEYEPDYQAPAVNTGGCYIATAVYGSYDCPEVWTLRRFRDNILAETRIGRCFIHTYYAISPTIVKWFGNAEWFKNVWKPMLDKMVKGLNADGVENTPYNDLDW